MSAITDGRCPVDGTELTPIVPNHPAVFCPTCRKRYCRSCGRPAQGSWSSGLCDGCYREVCRAERQREAEEEQARWDALRAERDTARASLAALVADLEVLLTNEPVHGIDCASRDWGTQECTCWRADLRRILANHKGDQS